MIDTDPSSGQLLVHLVSKLYQRTSVIVSTNLASGHPTRNHHSPRVRAFIDLMRAEIGGAGGKSQP
jgi:hypothetical protein